MKSIARPTRRNSSIYGPFAYLLCLLSSLCTMPPAAHAYARVTNGGGFLGPAPEVEEGDRGWLEGRYYRKEPLTLMAGETLEIVLHTHGFDCWLILGKGDDLPEADKGFVSVEGGSTDWGDGHTCVLQYKASESGPVNLFFAARHPVDYTLPPTPFSGPFQFRATVTDGEIESADPHRHDLNRYGPGVIRDVTAIWGEGHCAVDMDNTAAALCAGRKSCQPSIDRSRLARVRKVYFPNSPECREDGQPMHLSYRCSNQSEVTKLTLNPATEAVFFDCSDPEPIALIPDHWPELHRGTWNCSYRLGERLSDQVDLILEVADATEAKRFHGTLPGTSGKIEFTITGTDSDRVRGSARFHPDSGEARAAPPWEARIGTSGEFEIAWPAGTDDGDTYNCVRADARVFAGPSPFDQEIGDDLCSRHFPGSKAVGFNEERRRYECGCPTDTKWDLTERPECATRPVCADGSVPVDGWASFYTRGWGGGSFVSPVKRGHICTADGYILVTASGETGQVRHYTCVDDYRRCTPAGEAADAEVIDRGEGGTKYVYDDGRETIVIEPAGD